MEPMSITAPLPYAALIFDCDGTLTDSMPAHYESWRRMLSRYGIEFSEDRFYGLAGQPTDRIIALLGREQGIPVEPVRMAGEKEQDFLRSLHLLQPIHRVIDVVREQRGTAKLAVASGGLRPVVTAQLRQIGVLDWFDTIVTAEDTTQHKPAPDVFLEAARRLGVAPERCCVYEDADLGVEAARRAGMQCVDIRQFHRPRRVT
jgi:HAD superfamily hydrolase (TIGR01509 family)